MFAETKIEAPGSVKAVPPERVAANVVKAIEQRTAPRWTPRRCSLSSAAYFGLAPSAVASISKRLGGTELADAIGEAQREKR